MAHTLSMSIRGKLPKVKEDEVVSIETKEEAFNAQILFNTGAILSMPNDQRSELCQQLIDKCEAVKVMPMPVWHEAIDNPDMYKHLSLQYEYGII